MGWDDGILTGCFNHFALSCVACCLFPLTIYKNAEAVSEPGVAWIPTIAVNPCHGNCLRAQIRKNQNIEEEFWLGCLFWWCIPCCAVAQEARQLGTMDKYLPPQMLEMERKVKDSA